MVAAIDNGAVENGDRCLVIAGTHKGRWGTVEDWKLSKSGNATITVREDKGERFKTLARNVTKTHSS
ncbi:MAG: KOW motif-containing protein [Novosphingobium sp.]